jgi:peroxiredoxin
MARTPTYPIPLGFTAPNFELLEPASGKHRSLDALKGENATVLLFICNHCPFVVHVQDELVRLANDFMPLGVGFIAISSNDAEHYPQDGPSEMAAHALRHHYPFPYLYDETQEVAKAYYAACTPDISVFDAQIRCVYRGQLDASRPGNTLPVTGEDVRLVLNSLLYKTALPKLQTPSIGCNIKWKPGNEPDYY